MYKTHLATSIAVGAGLATVISFPFTVWYLGGISLGSLLPDIDEPRSFIGRKSFGLADIVNKWYGHRGATHSLFAWSLLTILICFFNSPFTLGLSLGYLFHIAGDYFSRSGVPLFMPITKKRFKFFLTYKTSSTDELIIFYVAILTAITLTLNEQLRTPLTSSIADLLARIIKFVFHLLDK
ncbi:inner membrane protein [Bacillus sp. OK048]|nr:inner membrane protein [Bacillus sp. OK048]